LKHLSADFVTSATGADGVPRDGLPQVACVGRSNVGKSSLINALCRSTIARTSAAPGKTRLANVYRVALEGGPGGPGRWSVYLVDLPGYGYARGGDRASNELRQVVEAYLRSVRPVAVLLLVDSRHPGMESDRAAARWIDECGIDRRVIATKIDKLTRGERARNLNTIEKTFGMAALPVSAESGEGLDALWSLIARTTRRP
jgi:GTP-binding protein